MEKIVFNLIDDYEGRVVASLFSYKAISEDNMCGSILYIHGYVDYFFQEHIADFFNSSGYNFYAIELRKYGSSYLKNQHFNYCRSLSEYFEEIDCAIDYICSDNSSKLTLLGHSTGGLIASLYAAKGKSRDKISKLILNSPFFEFNASWAKRQLVPLVSPISKIFPYISKENEIKVSYFDSIHISEYGEWSFNTDYKPRSGVPLYFAWLRAVSLGQRELKQGLNIKIPVLVLCSDKSSNVGKWCSEATVSDTVLNIKDIVKYSTSLGNNVEVVEVKDALHDVYLSNLESRNFALNISLKFLQ
ncbi:MAG: alpha/beta hydrolase [Rikenellaceae bacterium]